MIKKHKNRSFGFFIILIASLIFPAVASANCIANHTKNIAACMNLAGKGASQSVFDNCVLNAAQTAHLCKVDQAGNVNRNSGGLPNFKKFQIKKAAAPVYKKIKKTKKYSRSDLINLTRKVKNIIKL